MGRRQPLHRRDDRERSEQLRQRIPPVHRHGRPERDHGRDRLHGRQFLSEADHIQHDGRGCRDGRLESAGCLRCEALLRPDGNDGLRRCLLAGQSGLETLRGAILVGRVLRSRRRCRAPGHDHEIHRRHRRRRRLGRVRRDAHLIDRHRIERRDGVGCHHGSRQLLRGSGRRQRRRCSRQGFPSGRLHLRHRDARRSA